MPFVRAYSSSVSSDVRLRPSCAELSAAGQVLLGLCFPEALSRLSFSRQVRLDERLSGFYE